MEITLKTKPAIAVILLLMASIGVNVEQAVNDEGYIPYSCDQDTVSDMMCYKLSRVGTTGVNRYCYYDRDKSAKYKVCNAGWKQIKVDNYDEGFTIKECPFILSYTDEGRYICNGVGNDAQCYNEYLEPKLFEELE